MNDSCQTQNTSTLVSIMGPKKIRKRLQLIFVSPPGTKRKETEPSKCQLNDLPDELLLEVLSYLEAATITSRVRLVCSRWHKLCQDEYLWSRTTLHIEGNPTSWFIKTLQVAPVLGQLDLRKYLVPKSSLRRSDTAPCQVRNGPEYAGVPLSVTVALLVTNCTVRRLVLQCAIGIGPTIYQLLMKMKFLQELDFACDIAHSMAGWSGLFYLPRIAEMNNLRYLRLSGEHDGDCTDVNFSTKLEFLDIAGFKGVAGQDIVRENRKTLKVIYYSSSWVDIKTVMECPLLEETCLCCYDTLQGAVSSPNLKKLTVKCDKSHELAHVPPLTSFPSLEHVTLMCDNPTFFNNFLEPWYSRLKSVHFHGSVPWLVILDVLASTKLEQLGFQIDQVNLKELPTIAPALNVLHLSDLCHMCLNPVVYQEKLEEVRAILPRVQIIADKCKLCTPCQHLRWWSFLK